MPLLFVVALLSPSASTHGFVVAASASARATGANTARHPAHTIDGRVPLLPHEQQKHFIDGRRPSKLTFGSNTDDIFSTSTVKEASATTTKSDIEHGILAANGEEHQQQTNTEHETIASKSTDATVNLDRVSMRLERLEIYALIGALQACSSMLLLESIFLSNDATTSMTTLLEASLLLAAASATLLGLYVTMVFSMCAMYGKTALSMEDRDAE